MINELSKLRGTTLYGLCALTLRYGDVSKPFKTTPDLWGWTAIYHIFWCSPEGTHWFWPINIYRDDHAPKHWNSVCPQLRQLILSPCRYTTSVQIRSLGWKSGGFIMRRHWMKPTWNALWYRLITAAMSWLHTHFQVKFGLLRELRDAPSKLDMNPTQAVKGEQEINMVA